MKLGEFVRSFPVVSTVVYAGVLSSECILGKNFADLYSYLVRTYYGCITLIWTHLPAFAINKNPPSCNWKGSDKLARLRPVHERIALTAVLSWRERFAFHYGPLRASPPASWSYHLVLT